MTALLALLLAAAPLSPPPPTDALAEGRAFFARQEKAVESADSATLAAGWAADLRFVAETGEVAGRDALFERFARDRATGHDPQFSPDSAHRIGASLRVSGTYLLIAADRSLARVAVFMAVRHPKRGGGGWEAFHLQLLPAPVPARPAPAAR